MTPGNGPLRFWNSRKRECPQPGEQSRHESGVAIAVCRPEIEEEVAQLKALNSSLRSLGDIFPDIQPEVFREMLGTFPEESRLHVVTEALLKHKAKWVKGRWRVPESGSDNAQSDTQASTATTRLARRDNFRSTQYKECVKAALYDEFRGLSHSTVKAVLAEENYSYLDTRTALLKLATKSWRYSFTNLLTRRKTLDPEQCPLIAWRNSSGGILQPTLAQTACDELNEELELLLIAPLRAKRLKALVSGDEAVANRVNDEQATEENALYDCECCFSSYSFERIASCFRGDHLVCFSCIRRTMSEALYGQGWAKSVDTSKSSLKCIAAGSGDECGNHLPQAVVRRALESESSQDLSWPKFEDRLARDALGSSQLALNQCPFCMYAEVLDPPAPSRPDGSKLDRWHVLMLSLGVLCAVLGSVLAVELLMILILAYSLVWKSRWRIQSVTDESRVHSDPNFGKKFICRNESCRRISCLRCSSPWVDIHVCHQSSRQALRTYIESAVTDSIKRTCPKCNLSFVKSSGCNKLVCVCGYSMCYVCRQDVGKEGYSHFCPHFRVNPGEACHECSRCDLYRTEDDENVIRKAKEKAVADWKEQMQGKEGAQEMLANLEADLNEVTAQSRSNGRSSWWTSLRRS